MLMRTRRTILAGIVGCVVTVSIIGLATRVSSSSGDICALVGALVTGRTDMLGWLAGFVVQLVVGVIAAFVYAAIFEWVTRRAGIVLGLAIAVPHMVIAGLSVGFLPGDALIASGLLPVGAFFEYAGGWVVIAFVCAHLAFGAVVGTLYGRPRHEIPPTGRGWLQDDAA